MGFIEISKEDKNKSKGRFIEPGSIYQQPVQPVLTKEMVVEQPLLKNPPKPKKKSIDKVDSLGHLNMKIEEEEDTKLDLSTTLKDGTIKYERGVIDTSFFTIFDIVIKLMILIGVVIGAYVLFPYEIHIFKVGDTMSVIEFNKQLLITVGVISSVFLITCFILVYIINSSISKRFRMKYLTKVNQYIYDVIVVIINITLYTLVAVGVFLVINYYYDMFKELVDNGILVSDAKISLINLYKYIAVVVVGLFIGLNSLKCVSIVKKKNILD